MLGRLLSCSVCLLLGLGLAVEGTARGDEPSATADDYLRHVKPLLRDKCYVCHGVLRQEAGLRVDTAEFLRTGSDNGPIIDTHNPDASVLMRRLSAADPAERMPQEAAPLTAQELALIRRWLAAGAPGPADEPPQPDPRKHWAFRVPQRPSIPGVQHPEWVANPIDAFIVAKYEELGLVPRPLIDKGRWLRRVYLDVVGLPPTDHELAAFLQDPAPDAYERVVDRLLSSPAYGERWGRHWMDVWRYSDWYGRRMVPDVWNSAPQIWRWRDWIIRSLNDDKPYQQMVQEMLAGDELFPEDPDIAVATGFLIRNWYALNPNDWMRSNVEHTAKAFLGLTLNCAHCHDHKYDPITQLEYFRWRAYFEPLGVRQDRVPGQADPGPFQEYEYSKLRKVQRLGLVRAYDKRADAPTWFYTGGDERNRVVERGSIAPGTPAVFGPPPPIKPVRLPPRAYYPGLRHDLRAAIRQELEGSLREAEARRREAENAQKQLTELRAERQRLMAQLAEHARSLERLHPWAGQPALVLDASAGRRTLFRSLDLTSQSPHAPPEKVVIAFDLCILTDGHINFQLARDASQGLTAAYLGFIGGEIRAYQPGTFSEHPIGRYTADSRAFFHVIVSVDRSQDVCVVTVEDGRDGRRLVDAKPMALNGWDPARHPQQPLTWDARPGTVAALDNICVKAVRAEEVNEERPSERILWQCDFSAAEYLVGRDVLGTDGWWASSLSEPGGMSRVTVLVGGNSHEALAKDADALRQVDQKCWLLESRRRAAVAQCEAAAAALQALDARVTADDLRYGLRTDGEAEEAARQAVRCERLAVWRQAQAAAETAAVELAAAENRPPDDPKRTAAIQEAEKKWAAALDAVRRAEAAVQQAPDGQYSPLSPVYPPESTGRRTALARWITAPENPLFARVAVNHVWMRHFHQPLVETVFDFGNNGAMPTHPELLDYLAVEFIESGYSFKHLHRMILTSRTYRLASSSGGSPSAQLDPQNRYLWRMPVGRMEAEIIRDAILASAGLLDRTMGGQELENSESLTTFRRSIYYSCHPEAGGKSPFGELFDGPDPNECYRRSRSVMPQQALIMINSQLVQQASRQLAAYIASSLDRTDTITFARHFISKAFLTILSREPTEQELTVCLEHLTKTGHDSGTTAAGEGDTEPDAERLAGLIRVLFNHNDFIAVR